MQRYQAQSQCAYLECSKERFPAYASSYNVPLISRNVTYVHSRFDLAQEWNAEQEYDITTTIVYNIHVHPEIKRKDYRSRSYDGSDGTDVEIPAHSLTYHEITITASSPIGPLRGMIRFDLDCWVY